MKIAMAISRLVAIFSFVIGASLLQVHPISSLSCTSQYDPATVNPLGSVYRRPGEDLNLTCVANFSHETFAGVRYGAESLFFTDGSASGTVLKKTILNNTAIQTTLANLTAKDSGRYWCQFKKTNGLEETNLCSSQLYIGSDPVLPKDFRCISEALEALNCWWTLPAEVIPNATYHVDLGLTNSDKSHYARCNQTIHPKTPGDRSSLHHLHCTFMYKYGQYNPMSKDLYFTIGASSPLSNGLYIPLHRGIEFHHFRNVRPSAPEEVKATRVGSRNATIEWKIQSTLLYALMSENGLDHEIKYNSTYEPNQVASVCVNTTEENLHGQTMKYTLALPHPYTNYTVFVRSICGQANDSYKADLWSNDSKPCHFQTEPEAPEHAPAVHPGAYYFDSDGELIIYWEQISRVHQNGPEFHYVINFTDGFTPETAMEAGPDMFCVKLNGTSREKSLNFTVSAANKVGTTEGETIHVPAGAETTPLDMLVTSEEPGHFMILWKPHNRIDNVEYYAVFYCEKKPSEKNHQPCKTQPKRLQVNRTDTSLKLPLEKDIFYLFAVNAFYQNKVTPLRWTASDGDIPEAIAVFDYPVMIAFMAAATALLVCAALARPSAKRVKKWYQVPTILVPRTTSPDDYEFEVNGRTPDDLLERELAVARPPEDMMGLDDEKLLQEETSAAPIPVYTMVGIAAEQQQNRVHITVLAAGKEQQTASYVTAFTQEGQQPSSGCLMTERLCEDKLYQQVESGYVMVSLADKQQQEDECRYATNLSTEEQEVVLLDDLTLHNIGEQNQQSLADGKNVAVAHSLDNAKTEAGCAKICSNEHGQPSGYVSVIDIKQQNGSGYVPVSVPGKQQRKPNNGYVMYAPGEVSCRMGPAGSHLDGIATSGSARSIILANDAAVGLGINLMKEEKPAEAGPSTLPRSMSDYSDGGYVSAVEADMTPSPTLDVSPNFHVAPASAASGYVAF